MIVDQDRSVLERQVRVSGLFAIKFIIGVVFDALNVRFQDGSLII